MSYLNKNFVNTNLLVIFTLKNAKSKTVSTEYKRSEEGSRKKVRLVESSVVH